MSEQPDDIDEIRDFAAAHEIDLPAAYYSIDRYQIKRRLASGGMSMVMLAYDKEKKRDVALKVPNAQPTEKIEHFEKRFLREAKAALAVKHPNLCPLYHVGLDSDTFFLTMAYIEGMTLNGFLDKNGALSEVAASTIIVQVASGLAELHRHGIIHRDLKPDNIMIDRDGTPIVLDFGLAKFFTGQGAFDDLTETSQRLGTLAYMAPEQISGIEVTPQADQFSLGSVLWKLLCGCELFQGNPMKVVDKILSGEYVSPRQRRPDLSSEIEFICMTMMSFDPRARFESMDDVITELQAFIDQHSTDSD